MTVQAMVILHRTCSPSMQQAFLVTAFVFLCSCASMSQGWFFSRWRNHCYTAPAIGCFPTSYPYNYTGGLAPQSPRSVNVRFYLHTLRHRGHMMTLATARKILKSNYNPAVKTVVIIHGYLEHGNGAWIQQMVNELLRKEEDETNVVVVDWYWGARSFIYYQSAANARMVGALLALFLQELVSLGGDPSSFHMIGFSLGAHAAGYAGSRLRGIGRITGLDPAGPSFANSPPEARLDPTDAIFVDVIHTDIIRTVGLGTGQPMGTVDFYPNGGLNQPGCPTSMIAIMSAVLSSFDFSVDSVRSTIVCSHAQATQLFISSINNNCTYSTKRCLVRHDVPADCESCQHGQCPGMGYNLQPTSVSHGLHVYVPMTTEQWPFCENL